MTASTSTTQSSYLILNSWYTSSISRTRLMPLTGESNSSLNLSPTTRLHRRGKILKINRNLNTTADGLVRLALSVCSNTYEHACSYLNHSHHCPLVEAMAIVNLQPVVAPHHCCHASASAPGQLRRIEGAFLRFNVNIWPSGLQTLTAITGCPCPIQGRHSKSATPPRVMSVGQLW